MSKIAAAGIVIVALAALGAGGWYYYDLWMDFRSTQEDFAIQKSGLQAQVEKLDEQVAILQQDNRQLAENLTREEGKNQIFEDQIRDITGTVGDLTTLAETDEELLQKYSRVFFLSEHYVPKNLSIINSEWLYDADDLGHIHSQVLPHLHDLLRAARRDGTQLRVISAYRSFGEQGELKAGYTITYGTGSNQFSAEQGYSEHQLGTTVDFTTPELGADFASFDETGAYEWLRQNAHHYGLILSYPEDNTYYQFEPWHWRFVGVKLAQELHRQGVHFYDMSQREIDEYLIDLFE